MRREPCSRRASRVAWLPAPAAGRACLMPARLALACVALAGVVLSGEPSRADDSGDRRACINISFRPLEITVPACSRLIDGGMSGRALFVALRRRADAYHYGAQLGTAQTPGSQRAALALALTDLDRAAGLGVVDSDTQDPPFWLGGPVDFARGEVLFQLGRFTTAVEAYGTALAAAAGDLPSARFGRALALWELGRGEEALADMDALVAASPGAKDWLYHRGTMLEGLGRVDDAIADYRSVLARDPAHRAARQALERLGAAGAAN